MADRDLPTDISPSDPNVDGDVENDFGDKRSVSTGLLHRLAANISFLKQKTVTLEDSTDPELRKWIVPMLVDSDNSYGVKPNDGLKIWQFDDTPHYVRTNTFHDLNGIDLTATTARIDLVNGAVTLTQKQGTTGFTLTGGKTYTYQTAQVKQVMGVTEVDTGITYVKQTSIASVESTASSWYWDGALLYVHTSDGTSPTNHVITREILNTDCKGPWGGYIANTHWYVGWKRDEPYWATDENMADKFDSEMTSVGRAESITAEATGLINKVTLNVRGNVNCEDLCYVELRNFDTTKNVPGDTVLGRVAVDMRLFQGETMLAFPFPHPIAVTQGTKYAWVIRSPFTSYQNHIGIGGWGPNCNEDPYPGGDAYTSYDNCKTWVLHGRYENNPGNDYSSGLLYEPQDFDFIVHSLISSEGVSYNIGVDQYLYFEPIKMNPCTSTVLSCSYANNNGSVTFEVSSDRKNWFVVNDANSWTKNWSAPYPTKLWVRAKLRMNSQGASPTITGVTVNTYNLAATTGYLKTQFFTPRLSNPLGASIWSKIFAPVSQDPGVNVKIDIIRGLPYEEYIQIPSGNTNKSFALSEIPAEPLIECIHTVGDTLTYFMEYTDFTISYDDNVPSITFTSAPPEGVLKLRYYPIWMRNLNPSDFGTDGLKMDMMTETFTMDGTDSTVSLKVVPVDPIRSLTVNGVTKIQGIDYTVNFKTKEINFGTNLSSGSVVVVKYTPYLVDTSIALGYKATRPDASVDMQIKPYFFQVRV